MLIPFVCLFGLQSVIQLPYLKRGLLKSQIFEDGVGKPEVELLKGAPPSIILGEHVVHKAK